MTTPTGGIAPDLLWGSPGLASDRPGAASIVDRFAAVAAERGDAPAVDDGSRALTYAGLAEVSARWARGLRAAGVLPGGRVGICLDRSIDVVVAMLAVLRAGAAYVPMDPAYPDDRLEYLSSDAAVHVIIAEREHFPGSTARSIGPRDLEALGHENDPLPPSYDAGSSGPVDPAGAPAYIIYTSGTTGAPKGAVIRHGSVVALIDATAGQLALGDDDVWTWFHSSSFDFSVWEIWGSLLTGGRLVVVPYWTTRDPRELWDLLLRERVTVLSQTPSAFWPLVEVATEAPSSLDLRLVILGGERVDGRRLLSWFDRHPEERCHVVNMYGITETTVHVTAKTVTQAEAREGSGSVGRPIPGWGLSVRDEDLRPVPAGNPGEIVVAGAGLAAYYWRRPELTAARFVRDPYTGERIYRSGDLGRTNGAGELEHLGRVDRQVKIRGFRIELGEIEAVLGQAPGVKDAVVVVGGDPGNDPATARLDSYVVLEPPRALEAVWEHLHRSLPAHMLPTVTEVGSFPLTAHGKLDAAALPAPFGGP